MLSSALLPLFGEGFLCKNRMQEKVYSYSNLSTGGPSQIQFHKLRIDSGSKREAHEAHEARRLSGGREPHAPMAPRLGVSSLKVQASASMSCHRQPPSGKPQGSTEMKRAWPFKGSHIGCFAWAICLFSPPRKDATYCNTSGGFFRGRPDVM